ncbi:hypothetical protein [Aquipuribacter nitratireducens]|uniref:DUF559 domain-containing protein n=1 Tax=Aquipuribacter nitratireducens TaxID=650104 RepID=A0ABW0GIV0_9MICO
MDARQLSSEPFRTSAAAGLETPDALRGPRYRQVLHGAVQSSALPLTHGARVRAFRAVDGDDHVLLGPSAAWALGARFAEPSEPVVVGMDRPHRIRRRAEVVPHLATLRPEEVVSTAWGLATGASRTAFDLARATGTPEVPHDLRVARVDAVLRATGLPLHEVRDDLVRWRSLRGLRSARDVLADAADGVDSFRETRLRLLVVRAGLPRPRTQCPVVLDGRRIARLDLGWEELRVGCEYDGAVHDEPRQYAVDRARHNEIRLAGWRVLQVDRVMMRRPSRVVDALVTLMRQQVAAGLGPPHGDWDVLGLSSAR